MLSLKIPQFSGFAGRYSAAAAVASKDASEADLALTRRQAALDVLTQRASLVNAQESLATARSYEASAAEQVGGAKQYKNGFGKSPETAGLYSVVADASSTRMPKFG
ncbi:TolC family protein [Paraburkholderia sp. BL10I2N1]|uniref:TolC family protein n=1 Tax=Paraburkholderia sp. BL10I2N1 TaxID=1938796 RepID=UPI0010DAD7EC|nr:TolC family protein [Paraburkholderia sp. BL10I2N1]TDN62155.1 outer membrane efflux protein [Paraburkholderia sp. BL10I2N1]